MDGLVATAYMSTVLVGNVSSELGPDHLREVFGNFGAVVAVKIGAADKVSFRM